MITILRAAAIAVMIAAGSTGTSAASSASIITQFAGQPAPAIIAAGRGGAPVNLGSLKGKVVVVNLWATWCPPCRAELPTLERLAAAHPRDLVVLAISNDNGWPVVDRFWGHRFEHLRLSLASPDLMENIGVLGLPYTLVIDRRGQEVARVPRGIAWDQGAARQLVERSLSRR